MTATVSTTFCYNKEESSDELRVFCPDLFLSGEAVLDFQEWLSHASASFLFHTASPSDWANTVRDNVFDPTPYKSQTASE